MGDLGRRGFLYKAWLQYSLNLRLEEASDPTGLGELTVWPAILVLVEGWKGQCPRKWLTTLTGTRTERSPSTSTPNLHFPSPGTTQSVSQRHAESTLCSPSPLSANSPVCLDCWTASWSLSNSPLLQSGLSIAVSVIILNITVSSYHSFTA